MNNFRDFSLILFETKPGRPDVKSGIHPSLVTITINDILSRSVSIVGVVKKPILFSLSQERYRQVQKVIQELTIFQNQTETKVLSESKTEPMVMLKDLEIQTNQVMVKYDCKENNILYSVKAGFGESNIKVYLERPLESLSANIEIGLDRNYLVLLLNNVPYPVLDPFNVNITANKQFVNDDLMKNANVKIKTNHCIVHLGPNHLHIVETLKKSVLEIVQEFHIYDKDVESASINETQEDCVLTDTEVEEHHFQDDLRAGAFQFVESVSDQEPAPYQAVFGRNTLTWKYPQRRTLTKVVIFPLPFMEASDLSHDLEDGVDCELLYWSEVLQHHLVYQHFQLSETRVLHLDLPLVTDKRMCASSMVWQVRINRLADQAYITPQALLSVLKIDSFASSKLLPESQLSVSVTSLKFVLHNHLQFAGKKLSGELSDLAVDPQIPDDHPFLQMTLSPLSISVSVWPEDKTGQLVQYSFKTKLSLEFVDYSFLGVHHVVKPADVDIWLQHQDSQLDVTTKIGSVDASVGPFLIHSLRQSAKVWQQVDRRLNQSLTTPGTDDQFIPLSHIMVINETGQVIKFGQADTDEEIALQPKHCSMYCWRTNKASQKLRLSLGAEVWSEGFSLQNEGTRILGVDSPGSESSSSIILDIERKSSTLTLVKFCGLLNILNLLKDHLELR